ncbi:glycosyltransferase family 4 protein [Aerococcus urinaeequi]|uniref:glycosyltransferase family 4 protein n=1 Tax=Aerococcus urinaeequi TaxID=51665 RepID=UPI003ED90B3D
MINITIICFKYPPVYSGYGRQLKLIIDEIMMENSDISFTILTGFKNSEYQDDRVKIIPLLGDYQKKEKDTDVYPFSIEVFKWLIKNRKDISLVHCIKAGPEAMASNIFSKVFKVPLLVKVAQDELSNREFLNKNGFKKILIRTRQRFIGTANYFIAISDEISKNIQNRKSKKSMIVRIPNGVQVDRFHPIDSLEKNNLRKKLGFETNENILIYIGAINSRKGIPEFLDALEELNSSVKLKVVICGPILEDINFKERINRINNLSNSINIDYRGTIDNPEDYMKVSDIFILPSHSEGLPNVLLEAGACGLSLIATDIGGSREIVLDKESGLLVPVNNKGKIAQAITMLTENKELQKRFKSRARNHIVEHFSVQSVANQYINLYKKIKK